MSGGTLLVATAGGHVDELYELAGQCIDGEGRWWVTSRTPQTESLLEGQDVTWVHPVGARQVIAMLRSIPQVWSILRSKRPSLVVSTGAAMAVPYLVLARLMQSDCVYIESATRMSGPSVTGRIAERIPGVRLYAQSATWSRRRWAVIDSVFEGYVAAEREDTGGSSILVAVGTERFPFPRMLETLVAALEDEGNNVYEVAWQTGHTGVVTPLPGTHHQWWSARALREAAEEADLVVTHAGVGSILMALRAGRCPVLLPRLADLGEHVDNHQLELARQLQDRGLAMVAETGAPLSPVLQKAAGFSIRRRRSTSRAVQQ